MRFCLVQVLLVILTTQTKEQSRVCIHGDVNLVNGSNSNEGRVEVCLNGYWGTVCNDSWTYQDAQVVCKQLGYPYSGAKPINYAHYGAGYGYIHMDEVQCNGDEDYLLNCTFTQDHNCGHSQDAGVQCVVAECVKGEVYLVGGQAETEGQVEVCLGGRWGTVCDHSWTYQDAQVVCKQLGYPYSGATPIHSAHYGVSNRLIHMDEVQCTGDEDYLLNCTFIQNHTCWKYDDASVQCVVAVCAEEEVRLVGGLAENEGRVEVCLGGSWGTVCDDSWTYQDAQVVCKQLGYPYSGAIRIHHAHYGIGTGPIYMDEVQCTGEEDYLLNCTFIQNHNCRHFEDASVKCAAAVCAEEEVRLVGGSAETEGRVEVCLGGTWGTVCDDSWTYQDAQVVCKQLGYPYSGATPFYYAQYGIGTGPIYMDEVQCTGEEDDLLNCTFIQNHDCRHFEDASVKCVAAVCAEEELRLVGGVTEGRVEVCLGGSWGTVCDDLWTYQDAQVVCKQLGYPYSGATPIHKAQYGAGNGPIHMDEVQCTGEEDYLLNCTFIQNRYCWHNRDASVKCAAAVCAEEEVRLVGGSAETEGRVEVCLGGTWGTVCDDSWTYQDAQVVCKQLGYPYSGATPFYNAQYGAGNGPIHMDEVQCTGDEDYLINCTFIQNHDCLHTEDASVQCAVAECAEENIRLVGGPSETEGRVEVCLGGTWGTVCDHSWTYWDAQVVCKQLGYTYSGALPIHKAQYGAGNGPIHMDEVQCTSEEDYLLNCTFIQNHICRHSEDASVKCAAAVCAEEEVRLVGGLNETEGRVEVCLGGTWGTLCGGNWDESGAQIVCRQLGHKWSGAVAYMQAYSGQGSGPILLVYIHCDGNEDSILDCTFAHDPSSCTHDEDAGVMCAGAESHVSSQQLVPTEMPSIPNSSPKTIIISSSAVFIAFVIVPTILLCIIFYRRSKIRKVRKNHEIAVSSSPNLVSQAHLVRQTTLNQYVMNSELRNLEKKASAILQSCFLQKSNLRVIEKIGQGEFGIVFRGVLEEHSNNQTTVQAVAIKTLKGYFDESHIDGIFDEATKMKTFDHINVLSLFGVCLDLMEAPCIVMPFMGGGSLLTYLRKESAHLLISDVADENLIFDTTKQLLSMCLQVAKGMTYLAQENFVHRDLAARNCMISSEGLIKVADFGLSENLYTTEYFKQTFDSNSPVKLPIKWMALESIHYGRFNEKTDVWSYGVLCWEIFNLGKTPYPGMDPRTIVKILDAGERLSKPLNAACTEKSYSLMMSCWNEAPDQRQHFSEIAESLEQTIAPLAEYMDFTDVFNIKNEFID